VHAGSAYLSEQSLVQHFGLGDAARADAVGIAWPSGARTTVRDLEGNRRRRSSGGREGAEAVVR
jgi:ASPIC and UnbV